MPESYFDQRMKQMGITAKENCLPEKLTHKVGFGKNQKVNKYQYFEADKHDNIVINYFTLGGAPVFFKKNKNKWGNRFTRTRLKEPLGDAKYLSPKGSGTVPFFPPNIIALYQAKKPIDTLYFTEGEFKAFVAGMMNIPCVGLPSIHGFYGDKHQDNEKIKTIHYLIVELIKVCKVKNVVYLTDADTLSVDHEENKELTKRPLSFMSAVNNFRLALNPLLNNESSSLKKIIWAYILDKYNPESKGLDDLILNTKKEQRTQIKQHIAAFDDKEKTNKFFKHLVLENDYWHKLQKIFGLTSVEDFYKIYGQYIGGRNFLFKNAVYFYNGTKVQFLHHKDIDKFARIGSKWFKEIMIPNKYGELEPSLEKWDVGEIQRDYKAVKGFIDKVRKYDTFINVPDFTKGYRREINGCYNIVNPINYFPEEGTCEITKKFIKHIFQGEATFEKPILGDPLTVALDYLTIQYRYPKRMLPVPILVSPENGTGKTTFMKWLQMIYATNMTIVGNEQFNLPFNSHYISKYIIAIDEGFLEVEKKKEKERLKQLATTDTAFLHIKGVDMKQIQYYGKLMISSNDADSVMKIEDNETRWFVVRVPKFEGPEDNKLELKMKKEIPAWLHFLQNREIFHPDEGRLWFKPEYFITDQLRAIAANTKTYYEKKIDEFIKDKFLTFRLKKMLYSANLLTELINKESKYKIDRADIDRYLRRQKVELKPRFRFKVPIAMVATQQKDVDGNVQFEIQYQAQHARAYEFLYDKWLNAEELEEFNTEEIETNVQLKPIEAEDDLPF